MAELVAAYWTYQALRRGDRAQRRASENWFWAWEEIRDVVAANPLKGVALIAGLVDAAPDREALANVGAGPLEDLINQHSAAVVEAVEDQARRDARFREALTFVTLSAQISPGVVERLRRFAPGAP